MKLSKAEKTTPIKLRPGLFQTHWINLQTIWASTLTNNCGGLGWKCVFSLKEPHKLFATVYFSGLDTQNWRCFCFICGTN